MDARLRWAGVHNKRALDVLYWSYRHEASRPLCDSRATCIELRWRHHSFRNHVTTCTQTYTQYYAYATGSRKTSGCSSKTTPLPHRVQQSKVHAIAAYKTHAIGQQRTWLTPECSTGLTLRVQWAIRALKLCVCPRRQRTPISLKCDTLNEFSFFKWPPSFQFVAWLWSTL